MSNPRLIFIAAVSAALVFSCSSTEIPDLPPPQSEISSSSDDSSSSIDEWDSSSSIVSSSSFVVQSSSSFAISSSSIIGLSSGGTSSSSSILYCDFGVFDTYGGGCYIISSASECDTKYGTVRTSCPRKQYCDYGPETQYGGGCFEIDDANDCDREWAMLTNSCGESGFKGYCVNHSRRDCVEHPETPAYRQDCASLWEGVLMDSCPAGYDRYTWKR